MAGQLTIDTLKASSGVLATQNGMTGIAKAWVQFDGTNGTIRGSYNVGSVTRVSTGIYTVNFTTAMSNANYSVAMSVSPNYGSNITLGQMFDQASGEAVPTTTSFSCSSRNAIAQMFQDVKYVSISVFSS